MDPATARQILLSIFKRSGRVQAFLEKHPDLSLDRPDQAIELVRLASTPKAAVVRKPLDEGVMELRRRIATQDWNKILHTAKTLALCSLPVAPIEARTLVREAVDDKGTRIHVMFSSHDPLIPLPYGNDRALITWLMTLARERGSSRVEFSSAMEFLDTFGIDRGGKSYEELRGALERIGNVVITYGYKSTVANIDRDQGEKLIFARQLPTRHDVRSENTGLVKLPGMPNYFVQFGEQTFRELVSTPVSIPVEILKHYRNNPLAWDLINFIVAQANMLDGDSEQAVPFSLLSQFLGTQDSNPYRLQHKIKQVQKEVGGYLNFSVVGKGSGSVLVMRALPPELRPKSLEGSALPAISGGLTPEPLLHIEGEISLPTKLKTPTPARRTIPKAKKLKP